MSANPPRALLEAAVRKFKGAKPAAPSGPKPAEFAPRPYQLAAMDYFRKGGTRGICIWHRRGGKDLTALNLTREKMEQRRGAYWLVYPTETQGRKAIWEGFTKDGQRIMELAFPSHLRKSPRAFLPKAEMVVELNNGSIWRLMGSDRMEVVGAGPIGVVFSEFALAKPNTWDLVRPMLRENGGWAWFITTPRGKNHAKKLYDMAKGNAEWFCDLKTLWDTRAYDPEKTIAEERAEGMPEELIEQEYNCSFAAANVGSFYGKALAEMEARGALAEFAHGGQEVFTNWDFGKADDTAVWWWSLNGQGGVDVLDHYASHGEELEHYFSVVEERGKRYGWRYRKHWLPHDAKQRTLATKVSVLDQFLTRFGSSHVALVPMLTVASGISAVRRLLAPSRATRIHPRCSNVAGPKDCDGVEALRAYHREWDDEAKCFSERPVHDWSSHTADGFRYVAVVPEVTDMMTRPPEPPPRKGVDVVVEANRIVIDDSELFGGQ